MNRRDALKSVSLILGTSIIGAEAFLTGCVNTNNSFNLTAKDLALLNEIGETILPQSKTPGAREANVAGFMKTIVSDFYSSADQKTFKAGINQINKISNNQFNADYTNLTNDNRNTLVMDLEKQAQEHYSANKAGEHYYIMIKQLTIWGYLSSEVTAKQAFIFAPLIEKYEGSIEYKPGDKIVYTDFGNQGSAYSAAKFNIKKSNKTTE